MRSILSHKARIVVVSILALVASFMMTFIALNASPSPLANHSTVASPLQPSSTLNGALIPRVFLPFASRQETGGTLVIGREDDSVLLDAGAVLDGESWRVICEVMEPLVRLEGTTTKPIPWLAESWESADSQTWIFHLRHDVRFHDGSPFNAAVVKWNFDRWRDPANPYRFGRTFAYYEEVFSGDSAIEEVNVVDEYTVQIRLAQPSATILTNLALCGAFAMNNPQAVMTQGALYGTPGTIVPGTGAFQLTEWVPNDHISLARNAGWWRGPVGLDGITFRVIPGSATRLTELLAGTIHTGDLTQQEIATAATDPHITIYRLPPLTTGYIAFQQCTAPFGDQRVRAAIGHAVNWTNLIASFYSENGQLAGSFQPPTIFGSNPAISPIAYDPQRAKTLLEDAGYPQGFTTDFWYLPVIRSYFPNPLAIAQAIASDLAQVGIQVDLRTEDWHSYLSDRSQGKFPMWMLGWGSDNGDPDNFLGTHFSHPIGQPKPEDCYNNDRLAELLIQGRTTVDVNARILLYQEAEQIIHDDVARIPVAWVSSKVAMRNEVRGYTPMVFRSGYERVWVRDN